MKKTTIQSVVTYEQAFADLKEMFPRTLYLSKNEVCEVTDRSIGTVNRDIRDGVGIPFKKSNKRVLFAIRDVAKWMSEDAENKKIAKENAKKTEIITSMTFNEAVSDLKEMFPDSPILSKEQVCLLTGRSIGTLNRDIKEGIGIPFKKNKNRVEYHIDEVAEWMSEKNNSNG